MKKINNFMSNNIIIVIFIVAVIIGLANYLIYPSLIKSEYRMVNVAVANQTIYENTKITDKMIDYVSVPLSAVKGEIETDIVNKYVLEGSKIVQGGYFYKDLIGDKSDLTTDKVNTLKENEVAISIAVDSITSTNNLLSKNQYVDLYFLGELASSNGRSLYYSNTFGKVAENIRVVETYDNNNIATQEGNKNYVVLAVDPETYSYIKRAELLGKVIPSIKYDSYYETQIEDEFYSIQETRKMIDSNCKVLKRNVQ